VVSSMAGPRKGLRDRALWKKKPKVSKVDKGTNLDMVETDECLCIPELEGKEDEA